jgi:opacity protein-like surface antigen
MMRFKTIFAVVAPAFLVLLLAVKIEAQVAPSAKVNGIPLAISVGMSDYDLDYGPGRRMQGPVVRAGAEVFHGLGIDLSARALFMNTPSQLTRMQQNTFLGGVYYDTPALWRVHPFVRFGAGIGNIEFPSKDPKYTRDDFLVYAPSGGIEYPVTRKLSIRAEYEYQSWQNYLGKNTLNPQGGTVGVTYYVSGRHLRPHPNE